MALTTIKLTNSTTANSNVGNLSYTGGLFNSNVPIVLNDISTQFDGSKAEKDFNFTYQTLSQTLYIVLPQIAKQLVK